VRVVHSIHCPDLGPVCLERDEPGQLHDQTFSVAELRPVAEYAFNGMLSVELQLPLRLSATTIRYRRLDGSEYVPDYVDIHHRNETLVGLGDPWVSARARARLWETQLALRAGLSLPLGRTEPDPFALGAQGEPHQHVQFGTGTLLPLLGVDAARELGPVRASGYVQAQLSLYENQHGYLAGTRLTTGLSAELTVVGALRASLAVDLFHEEPERWGGEIQQDGNLGRTDFLVGLGVSHPLGGYLLTASVKVPVYQHIVSAGPEAGQLSYPAIVSLAVGRVFDLAGK